MIEQLSQFYKTSAKVTAETIQYTPDSTYKAVQEEWTRIEGMIQSKLERIIQETHVAGEAAKEVSILAESTEDQCSKVRAGHSAAQVKAMTSMPKGTLQNLRVEDSVTWTASTRQSHHSSCQFPHTSSEFSKQELQCLSTFQLAQQVFDDEEDKKLSRRGKSAQSITSFKMKQSCRSKVRGCALNSVEHPHGEGNHEHDQILAPGSTKQ